MFQLEEYFGNAKVVHHKLIYWRLASKLGRCLPCYVTYVKFYIIILLCNFVSIAETSISDFCLDQKLPPFRTGC